MRLFVAVDLNEEARAAIAAEQHRVMAGLGDASRSLRWVGPARLHLTLVFIGEADELQGARIVDAMSGPIDLPSFRLSFGGIGIFPSRGNPRALFVGVVDGLAEAVELQRRVVERLQGVGVSPEAGPFRPHLTLARWRHGRASGRRLVAPGRSGIVAVVDVTETMLYQSQLSPTGPSYTPLARASLT